MKPDIPFDLSRPGVAVMRSPMGGGWAWAYTDEGAQALFGYFQEPPAQIPVPIGEGAFPFGYIVEPNEAGDLAEHLREAGVAWKVE